MHSGLRGSFVALWMAITAVAAVAADVPTVTKLAVVDFELEDGSAGASVAGDPALDKTYLAAATAEVRKVIEQSGRYRLVDASDAEQSLIGVVKRITRTEYVVGIQLRDTKTGTLLSHYETDLQMGANYSWGRGAARLVKDNLLANPPRQSQ